MEQFAFYRNDNERNKLLGHEMVSINFVDQQVYLIDNHYRGYLGMAVQLYV